MNHYAEIAAMTAFAIFLIVFMGPLVIIGFIAIWDIWKDIFHGRIR